MFSELISKFTSVELLTEKLIINKFTIKKIAKEIKNVIMFMFLVE